MSPWETTVKVIKANREKKPLKSKIQDIPRYDWLKDPNKWRVNGLVPDERCQHCGWRFLDHKIAPFCVVCYTKMWPGDPGDIPKHIKARLRVPEDYNFETNQNDLNAKVPIFTPADKI